MKSFTNLSEQKISKTQMNNLKGGTTTTVVVETMVEVTTVNQQGATNILYCDRRRKRVNC